MKTSEGTGSHMKIFLLYYATFCFRQVAHSVRILMEWMNLVISYNPRKWHDTHYGVTPPQQKSQQNAWTTKDSGTLQNTHVIDSSILVLFGNLISSIVAHFKKTYSEEES
jgi:hypothetical protein